jgi:hypothetical protein
MRSEIKPELKEMKQLQAQILALLAEVARSSSGGSGGDAGGAGGGDTTVALAHPWSVDPKDIRFELEENEDGLMAKVELGRGSFGVVYKGTLHGKDVAVKEMPICGDSTHGFVNEAQIAFRSNHPNTITHVLRECSALP